MRIAVVTDSTASLHPTDAERENIVVVPVSVIVGTKVHTQGVDVTGQQIADALRDKQPVTTSRPAPETFLAVYENLVRAGAQAICSVHLSGRLSGTVDSARTAGERCSVPVRVVDTRLAGVAVGLATGAAARVRDAGGDLDAVVAAAESAALSSTVLVYVDTLEYLKRGGRIGAASAFFGSALAVKPILTIADGQVAPRDRVRTRSRALERLRLLAADAARAQVGDYDIGVQHLDNEEAACEVADKLAAELGHFGVPVDEVGADIGAHVGPGMVAVTVTGR